MSKPTAGPSAPQGERATLSRELSDFLIEFSIALNKHAMYPGGHPSLAPASERVVQRLNDLLVDRSSISLGVARDQLVIEGVATDSKHPVLSDLASRIHRHHLGAIRFTRGAGAEEIRSMLSLVSIDADRAGQPLGLGPAELLTAWPHVRLYALAYERLELIEEDKHEGEEEEIDKESRTRAAQLWLGLARAALTGEEGGGDGEQPTETDPSVVASAIDQHAGGTAYDQVIVGYMLQIAEEVRSSTGRETGELNQRVSELVRSLDPQTLQNLLQMGGDHVQRREFVLNASEGMAPEAVIELARAAAKSEQQNISHSMQRMLQKFAQHAETGSGRRATESDAAVRDQIAQLVTGWSLADPNPDAYRQALQSMATKESVFAVSPEQEFRPESKRLLQMAIEVDVFGEPVSRAVDDLVEGGGLKWILQTLEGSDTGDMADAVWQRVATPETVKLVAETEPLDVDLLDMLLTRVGVDGAEPMLDVLAESESRHVRRALLDRLVRLGPDVGPLAMARLADPRWYVQRNMLTIIGDLPRVPPGFNAEEYLKHPEARMRLEAFRILLRDPAKRERAIGRALTDGDERTVTAGLKAAMDSCPRSAIPLIVSRITSAESQGVRTLAVRVLGPSGGDAGLKALLAMVAPRRRFFRTKPPPKTPEYLAALAALHHFDDGRARRALADAAKSRDPEIARAAQRGYVEES